MKQRRAAELLPTGYLVLDDACPPSLVAELFDDAQRYEFVAPGANGGGAFAMGRIANPAPAAFAAVVRRLVGPDFVANEVSYQRYVGTTSALRVHRDQRFYANCIAIATLSGSATFGVHAEPPPRPVIAEWETKPGQVILLRGWNPGHADPRPFHRVDAPTMTERVMVQLRMNLLAVDPSSTEVAALSAREIEQGTYAATFPETQRRQDVGPES